MAASNDLPFFSSPNAQPTDVPTLSIPFLGPPRLTPPTVSLPESTPGVSLPGSVFSTPTTTPTDTPTSSSADSTSPSASSPSDTPTTPIDSSTPSLTSSDPFSATTSSASTQTSSPIVSGTLPSHSTTPLPSLSTSSSPSSTSSPFLSSASSTSSSPAGILPVSDMASHDHHAGAIAGGVIGGIALLVAIICTLLFARSRRQRRSPAATNTFRKWDGLASRESGFGHGYLPNAVVPSAYQTSAPTRHSSTASTAAMLGGRKSSVGHGIEYDDEKSPATAPSSSHGHEPLDYAAPTNAWNAYQFPAPMIPATSAAFASGRPRDRSHSHTQSRALALASLETGDPSSPPPVTPLNPYNLNHGYNRHSLDGRMLSSPPTSPTLQRNESIKMNRTSMGRHPTRKPVPKYNEGGNAADDAHAQPPTPTSQTPTPEMQAAARDSVYFDSRATPSASSSTSHLHGGSSNVHSSVTHAGTSVTAVRSVRSREDLIAAGYQIPKLSEKASFGDMRNVHYLIPDPPPEPRD